MNASSICRTLTITFRHPESGAVLGERCLHARVLIPRQYMATPLASGGQIVCEHRSGGGIRSTAPWLEADLEWGGSQYRRRL